MLRAQSAAWNILVRLRRGSFMPAKKTLKAATEESVGAPAAAKRLEEREAAIWSRIERLEADLAQADNEFAKADGDDEKQKGISAKIALINKDLMDTQKSWLQLTKQVREFDASIDTSRREGEKISRTEAEEFFRQFRLSIKLSIEKYIISLSQDATRAESPEQFYQAHADNIRTAMLSEIENAHKDGKIPAWAIE